MLKPQVEDRRRFQMLRLQTYLNLREELVQAIKVIPRWDPAINRNLVRALDDAIKNEIIKLNLGA